MTRLAGILLFMLVLQSPAFAGTEGHSKAFQTYKDTCERWVFSAVNQPVLSSAQAAKALRTLAERSKNFIKTDRADEDAKARRKALSALMPKWRPVILQRLNELGIFAEEIPGETEADRKYVVDRNKLIELHPEIADFLPEGYRFVLTPGQNLLGNHMAYFEPVSKEVGLPFSILFGEIAEDEMQDLVHEYVHLRLSEQRIRSGSRLFAHRYEFSDSLNRTLSGIFQPVELDPFVIEEAITYLVNGLNYFELNCAKTQQKRNRPYSGALWLADAHLQTFLDIVLPLVRKAEGDLVSSYQGIVYLKEKTKQVRVLLVEPDGRYHKGDDEAAARAMLKQDLKRDEEVLKELASRLASFQLETGFQPKPRDCAKTKPLWDFLKTLGLNPDELKLAR